MHVSQPMSQHLSLSPGSIILQAILLLTLLVAAAIALTQSRRDRRDALSRRLMWGAIALLALRAGLLLAAFLLDTLAGLTTLTAILPPLEWAIDAVTTVVVIWIVAPQPKERAQIAGNVFLFSLILPAVLYAFIAPAWISQAGAGVAYAATWQARVWSAYQLLILAAGMAFIVSYRAPHFGIRLAIPAILLATHVASPLAILLTSSAGGPPHPVTFGYLAAFPLLAILAYQQTVSRLVEKQPAEPLVPSHLVPALPYRPQELLSPNEPHPSLQQTLLMAARLLPVDFVALMRPAEDGSDYVYLTGLRPGRERDGRDWALSLTDWPAFRLALELGRPIELNPQGIGARQLFELYDELGLEVTGPLLVEPLIIRGQTAGLLLLGSQRLDQSWSAEDREMIALLAGRVAQSVDQAPRFRSERATQPAQATADRGDAHKAELAALLEQIETLQARLLAEQQEKQGLAAALAAREEEVADRVIADLEAEVATLRQSLRHAEEELERMVASDSRIDVEWVSRTVSGYSAALSQTESRVAELEDRLGLVGGPESSPVVVSLVEELRALITSVADRGQLLLNRKSPAFSEEAQRLIRWMQTDIHRVRLLLEQLLHLLVPDSHLLADEEEAVDLRQLIRQAVLDNEFIREHRIKVETRVSGELPPLLARQRTVYHILSQLLGHLSLSMPLGGQIVITARPLEDRLEGREYFTLTITQRDGGVPVEAPPKRLRGVRPEATSLRGDTVDVALVRTLVLAVGGRLWVEQEAGQDRQFTVILPLWHRDEAEDRPDPGEG